VRAWIRRYNLRSPDEPAQSISSKTLAPGPDPSGPDLRIYTLGRFAVFVGSRAILETPTSAPARQLLKVLVTRHRHHVSANPAAPLGPPPPDPHLGGLPSLQSALVEAGGEPMAYLLVRERDTVGLHPDAPIWIDADAFERILAEARQTADPLVLLREANALHAGEYLPDDLQADWSVGRREELRQMWIGLQLTLARVCEEHGELDEAAAALRRLLAKDATDERAAQELVRLLLRGGMVAEARSVHARLVDALGELGVEPSPGSLKLARELGTDRPE